MPVPGTLKKQKVDSDEVGRLLLEKFDLDRRTTNVYLTLVIKGEESVSELAKELQIETSSLTPLLDRMLSQGLVIRSATNETRFAALHPRMSMTNIFKVYEAGLVKNLRDRRAVLDRIVNLLTPVFEDREQASN